MFKYSSRNNSKHADLHPTDGYFDKHLSLFTHEIYIANIQNNTQDYRNNNLPNEMHEWIGSIRARNDIVLHSDTIDCHGDSICSYHVWDAVWTYIRCASHLTTYIWELLLDSSESWAYRICERKTIDCDVCLWAMFYTYCIYEHLCDYLWISFSTFWHIHWA